MDATNIISSINAIADKIFASVEGEVFNHLDNLLIVSEKILEEEPLKYLMVENTKIGFVVLTGSFITFFAICYVITRICAMYNGKQLENPWKYILRTIVCVIISMSSFYLFKEILTLNGMITSLVVNIAKDITGDEICFASLRTAVLNLNEHMSTDFLSVDGLIRGVVSFGSCTLLITLAIRYVSIMLLLIISPITIMLATNDATYGIFNSWCKMLIKNLLIQNVIVLIIAIPIAFKNTNNQMYKIVLVGSIYLLYRINNLATEMLSNIAIKR